MRRKTFDGLMVTGGVVLAAVLLVAGGLLTWAHAFVGNQVREQLTAQKIFFPEAGSDPRTLAPGCEHPASVPRQSVATNARRARTMDLTLTRHIRFPHLPGPGRFTAGRNPDQGILSAAKSGRRRWW